MQAQETPEREDHFLARVLQLARAQGWVIYHTHRATRSPTDCSGIVGTDGARILFAEIDSVGETLTADQAEWLALLCHTGRVDTYVWRPADWPQIVEYFTKSAQEGFDELS